MTQDSLYPKVRSALEQVTARKGQSVVGRRLFVADHPPQAHRSSSRTTRIKTSQATRTALSECPRRSTASRDCSTLCHYNFFPTTSPSARALMSTSPGTWRKAYVPPLCSPQRPADGLLRRSRSSSAGTVLRRSRSSRWGNAQTLPFSLPPSFFPLRTLAFLPLCSTLCHLSLRNHSVFETPGEESKMSHSERGLDASVPRRGPRSCLSPVDRESPATTSAMARTSTPKVRPKSRTASPKAHPKSRRRGLSYNERVLAAVFTLAKRRRKNQVSLTSLRNYSTSSPPPERGSLADLLSPQSSLRLGRRTRRSPTTTSSRTLEGLSRRKGFSFMGVMRRSFRARSRRPSTRSESAP